MTIHKYCLPCLVMGLISTGCTSVSVYELPKVQQNLSQALQSSEDLTQKSEADYKEKKALYDNLAKANSPQFAAVAPQLKSYLNSMDDNLGAAVQRRKEMQTANSEIASLSYNHPKVFSNDDNYPRVDEAVKSFEKATADVNLDLANYSRNSNAFADLVESKRLYFNFEAGDFQKKIVASIHSAQENLKGMQNELNRAQNILNHAHNPNIRAAQQTLLSDMEFQAKQYTDRAQSFARISRDMNLQTVDNPRVSSVDSNWPAVQKLRMEYDRTVQDLAGINARFQKDVESFRTVR